MRKKIKKKINIFNTIRLNLAVLLFLPVIYVFDIGLRQSTYFRSAIIPVHCNAKMHIESLVSALNKIITYNKIFFFIKSRFGMYSNIPLGLKACRIQNKIKCMNCMYRCRFLWSRHFTGNCSNYPIHFLLFQD